MTGWLILTGAWTAVNAAGALWYHREIRVTDGRRAAYRTSAVLWGSLVAYLAVLLVAGFGFAGQLVAGLISGAVLVLGRKWIALPAHVRWLLGVTSRDGKDGPR